MPSIIFSDISTVTTSIAIGIVTYVTYFYFKYFTRPNPIPGPIPLPFFGNLHQYPGTTPDITEFSKACQKKYGDIWEFYLGHPSDKTRSIGIGRADLLEKIYTTNHACNFTLRTPPNDGLDEFDRSTKGLLYNRDYNTWSYYRKFFNRAVMAPKFIRQAVSWTEESFEEMEGYWKRLGGDTVEIDLPQWMLRLTTDAILRITTNKKVYALANHFNEHSLKEKVDVDSTVLKESDEFIERINDFVGSLEYFLLTPKWVRYLPIGGFKQKTLRLLKERDLLINDLLHLVTQRRKEINLTPLDAPVTPDMLTMFLTVNTDRDITVITDDTNVEPISDEAIIGNFMEAIAGGIDTTTGTTCFISYCLARYPEAKKRLFEEIDSKFSRDQRLSYEDLQSLPYCEAVIREVSRLIPTVDLNYRMNTEKEILDGYVIPAETQFFIYQDGMNKHKAHWDNPEEFNPDRFLNGQNKNLVFQFGGGVRMCPGRNLAMMQLKAIMVMLYRKYDIELVDKNQPLKTHYSLIRHCDELKVRIKPRK